VKDEKRTMINKIKETREVEKQKCKKANSLMSPQTHYFSEDYHSTETPECERVT
jgi:hypothetical protein